MNGVNFVEYDAVPFWTALDYVGVDAYFPLSQAATPTVRELKQAWQKEAKNLATFAQQLEKPILFTEFGYRSIDKTAWKQWELPDDWRSQAPANLIAQTNAYEAIFQTFWSQPWFAGGFLWKWYDNHPNAGGPTNSDYTPQRKPAEEIIRKQFLTNKVN